MGEDGDYWRPQVMRHIQDDGVVEFAFHDVYFSQSGSIRGCTIHARSNRKATVQELEKWIRQCLADSPCGVNCGDLGHTHDVEDLLLWLDQIGDPPIDYNPDVALA